ncbi:hypothetical protein KAI04_03045 [Candidatus Pacearchaeota archaeon]|nr:hypothetical protein [Candidatus Pacearchaeota archaeon]
MVTNVICKFASVFDIIEFIGFLGITIIAGIFVATREKGLKIAKKLGIKTILIIILWVLTALIMFYDAFIC